MIDVAQKTSTGAIKSQMCVMKDDMVKIGKIIHKCAACNHNVSWNLSEGKCRVMWISHLFPYKAFKSTNGPCKYAGRPSSM